MPSRASNEGASKPVEATLVRMTPNTEQDFAKGLQAGNDVEKDATKIHKEPTTFEDSDISFDRGYAWVVCLGCFLINTSSWGVNGSFGVFLSFYVEHDYFPDATSLDFAFIGGLSLSLAMLCGPLSNWTSRTYGPRYTMFLGCIFLVGSQIASAFATTIWQLFLSQAVCFGLGLGCIMVNSGSIVAQWFQKKRALATGITAGGSGAGALLFSNVTRKTIQTLGLRKAFLINAGISAAILVPACCLVRARTATLGSRFDPVKFSLYKNKGFLSLCMWGIFTQLSYTVGIYSIPVYATAGLGLSQTQGSTLQSLLATGQLIGRPLCGVLLDRLGRINGALIVTVASGLTCLFIWMFAKSFGVLALFAFLQGGLGGIFWSSSSALVSEIIGIRDLYSGLSMLWLTIVIPATFAEPIAFAFIEYSRNHLHRTGSAAYLISIGFAGAMFCLSGLSLFGAKFYKQRSHKIWQKV